MGKVSEYLQENYEDYVYGERETVWRTLCAIDKAAHIVQLCEPIHHDSILEIGSGEGAILNRLSDLSFGTRYFGVELSSRGVKETHARGIKGLQDCKVFDGTTIPHETKSFDIAVLSHVVEHLEYPRQLLYEASRVAKHVFVEVPLEYTSRMPQDFVFNKVGHINFYTPRSIRYLVQSCQLEVLNQIVVNPSRAVYVHEKGRKGVVSHLIKETALNISRPIATSLFTYQSALLCQPLTS